MAEIPAVFDGGIDFDPQQNLETLLKNVPAKWAVCLYRGEADTPLQLLSVKNLRASLRRRLGEPDAAIEPSKRVDYRQIVRRIDWRRVDSDFEANWIYHDLFRRTFPDFPPELSGFRPAWWICVNPAAEFPRYVKTTELTSKESWYFGPIVDKHLAARLIETVEDAFDLCRYYHILLQAPNGRACAYKEMGKCPAPCDGSITMPQYRRMIEWSANTLTHPEPFIREQEYRMHQAAGDLRFESARKIKTFIEQISKFRKGPLASITRLDELAFVAIQPGPGTRKAKVFLILPGQIEEIAGLIDRPRTMSELMRLILTEADQKIRTRTLDAHGAGRMAVVAHHLTGAAKDAAQFLPLAEISEAAIERAIAALAKRKTPEIVVGAEEEGIVKEAGPMRGDGIGGAPI